MGDETISGENDVEYAEFSLSVRTSPKEHIHNNSIESNSSNGMAECSTAPNAASVNGFDDFMALPISSQPSNLSSKCIFIYGSE